jgi:hypothetical protein
MSDDKDMMAGQESRAELSVAVSGVRLQQSFCNSLANVCGGSGFAHPSPEDGVYRPDLNPV